jgi:ABC-type glycerol-3-phosphate transport system substrate-binding protein
MNKSLFLSVLLISVLLISGCGKSGTTEGSDDNGAAAATKGTLVMQITDAPAALNIQKAEVTIWHSSPARRSGRHNR